MELLISHVLDKSALYSSLPIYRGGVIGLDFKELHCSPVEYAVLAACSPPIYRGGVTGLDFKEKT